MYASRTTQLIVGLFTLLGIAAMGYLSFSLGKMELLPAPGYTIYADFDNISGLKTGDRVEIAGVQIGKVLAISLRKERARVGMRLRPDVKVDNEAIAAIKTSGIIGDKYVSIAPGPGDHLLVAGDTLRRTESSFVLEDAIGQLISQSGSEGGEKDKDNDKGPQIGKEPGKTGGPAKGKK
ncbi:MAG: outer membrane lipid asymmetry maintenance protein MlaD [Candidatus Binataceae bacterium]